MKMSQKKLLYLRVLATDGEDDHDQGQEVEIDDKEKILETHR